jgi:hypothetical protein
MNMRVFLFVLLSFYSLTSFATHIRGGEITVKRISELTYQITLRAFANVKSPVKMGAGTLGFGDGTETTLDASGYRSTSDPEVGIYLFFVTHTYPGQGFYKVTYTEQNLDEGIINVENSVNIPLYLESGVVIDPLFPNYSFAKFATDPLFLIGAEEEFSFAASPVEATNSIYNYQLVVPGNVASYTFPENLNINSQTGLMIWDTKFNGSYQEGQYLFAVRVTQFDKDKNFLGYVTRVFTVDVETTTFTVTTTKPVTDALGKITVLNGNQKSVKVILSDNENPDALAWTAYYDSTALTDNIVFTQYDSATTDLKFKVGVFQFSTTSPIVRDLPYEIILRGTPTHNGRPYETDLSFLIFTKDIDLPVVAAIKTSEKEQTAFPNPFTNELHFSGATQGSRVEIYNGFGKKVESTEVDSDGKIDTSQIPNGIYILTLADQNQILRFKVMKK